VTNPSGIDVTLYPDPILRQKAKRILKIDTTIKEAVDKMLLLTYKKNGYGMAGPQLELPLCFFSMNSNPWNPLTRKETELVFINPKIEYSGKLIREKEGCLSIPRFTCGVPRYEKVIVKAKNLQGEEFTYVAEDKEARIIQHEMDHLEGKLIIDYASLAELAMQQAILKVLEKQFKSRYSILKRSIDTKIKKIVKTKNKKIKNH
jgi:peptide deformylase